MVMVDNYIFGSHSWLFGNWWVNEVEDDKTEMARKYMKIIPDGGALLKGWDIMQPQDVAHTSFEKPWETRPSKEDSFWEQLQLQNRKNREIEGAVGSKLCLHHQLAVCEGVPKTSNIGTPSWYCEQVQDSLALVMVMGKPTYFLTLFATPSGLTSLEDARLPPTDQTTVPAFAVLSSCT